MIISMIYSYEYKRSCDIMSFLLLYLWYNVIDIFVIYHHELFVILRTL